MKEFFKNEVGKRLPDLSSQRYRTLSVKYTLFAFVVITIMMLMKQYLIENTIVDAEIYSYLGRTLFYFILGISGLIIMLRGDLQQAFIRLKGKSTRIFGFLIWSIMWWASLSGFISLLKLLSTQ